MRAADQQPPRATVQAWVSCTNWRKNFAARCASSTETSTRPVAREAARASRRGEPSCLLYTSPSPRD
eukprot:490944-Alexandrium_andersonii.AAC.1